MLGWTYIHDEFGRELKGNFDLPLSLKEYKRVTEIDSTIPNAWRNLAVLNEYDNDGRSPLQNVRVEPEHRP